MTNHVIRIYGGQFHVVDAPTGRKICSTSDAATARRVRDEFNERSCPSAADVLPTPENCLAGRVSFERTMDWREHRHLESLSRESYR